MVKYGARGLAVDFEGTPIGQLTAFDPVGSSRGQIDASAYGEDWTDQVLGLKDGDEVTAVIAYDPADSGHNAIVTAYETAPDTPVTLTVSHADSGWAVNVTAKLIAVRRGGQLNELFALTVGLKIVNPGVVDAS